MKFIETIKQHWGKMLLALMAAPFVLVFSAVLPFVLLFGFAYAIDFLGVRSLPARHDTSVPNSPFIDMKVEFVPFARVYKLKDKKEDMFSWTDRYLTLYAGEYTSKSNTVDNFGEVITNRDSEGFMSSKVIDVRYQTQKLSSIKICILQNTRDIDHWFWIQCKYIKHAIDFAQSYRKATEEIKNNKVALLILGGLFRSNSQKKPYLKFDRFNVYKFHSIEELEELLGLPIEYPYIAEKKPLVIRYRDVVTEDELKELYSNLDR